MPAQTEDEQRYRQPKAPTGTPEAARRLFAASKPISGSPVKAYLGSRHITDLAGCDALRFHPRCYYRASEDDAPDVRPAWARSEEHTSELQSLMRLSYAVLCLKKKKYTIKT